MPPDSEVIVPLFAILVAVLVFVPQPCALAQASSSPPPPADDARARDLYREGQAAFDAGDFDTAYARFHAAYDLSHRTALLYNLGHTADRLSRDDEAIAWFEQYVAETPADAPQRADAEARLQALTLARSTRHAEARRLETARLDAEQRRREAEAARARAEAEAAAAREGTTSSELTAEPAFWIGVVGAGVVIAGGIVLAVVLSTPQDRPGTIPGDDGIVYGVLRGSF